LVTVIRNAASDAVIPVALCARLKFIDRNLRDRTGCAILLQATGLTRIMASEATGNPEAKHDSADDNNYLSSHSIPSKLGRCNSTFVMRRVLSALHK
jgi:hypothetical protein